MKKLPAHLPKWSRDFKLGDYCESWDEKPIEPGVYLVLSGRPINRAGGRDPSGILYVGKASDLRNRLWDFRYARQQHLAADFLSSNPDVARLVLQAELKSSEQVIAALGNLRARVASPLPINLLAESERAVIWAYIIRYGEPPPMNSALPQRDERPEGKWLKWARTGIAVGIS